MATVNTPDQTKAIRALMASRKRAWLSDGRTVADFPRWHPKMTTAAYVQAFSIGDKHALSVTCRNWAGVPAAIVGPEVRAELIDTPELMAA